MIKKILFFIIITWVALMGLSSVAKAEGLIEAIMYHIIINNPNTKEVVINEVKRHTHKGVINYTLVEQDKHGEWFDALAAKSRQHADNVYKNSLITWE